MPGAAVRVADVLGPGGLITGPVDSNVLINGRPVALIGAAYTPHPCCGAKKCPPTHCFGATLDSPVGIFINGVPPLTKSGKGICGHGIQTASPDVFFVGGGMGAMLGGMGLGLISKVL